MVEQTCSPDELLARFAYCPEQLRTALTGLADADLDRSLSPGAWTIRQLVHHIVDGDDLWKACIKAALGNCDGVFSLAWYWDVPQERWAEQWSYAQRPVEPSLAFFEASRTHVVDMLQHTEDGLDRHVLVRWPGEREQEVPVWWVVEMQTRHVSGHLGDIAAIRQAHGL